MLYAAKRTVFKLVFFIFKMAEEIKAFSAILNKVEQENFFITYFGGLKMKKLLPAMLLSLLFVAVCWGDTVEWLNLAGDQDFSNPSNWWLRDPNGGAGSAVTALDPTHLYWVGLSDAANYPIINSSVSTALIAVGSPSGDGRLDILSGDLIVSEIFYVGNNNTTSVINFSGGSIDAVTVKVGNSANGDGTMNITGGTITGMPSMYIGELNGTGTLNIDTGSTFEFAHMALSSGVAELNIAAGTTINSNGFIKCGGIENQTGGDATMNIAGTLNIKKVDSSFGWLGVGWIADTTATVNVTDNGILTVESWCDFSNGSAADTQMLVKDNGQVTFAGSVKFGEAGTCTATLTDNASVTASSSVQVGTTSTGNGTLTMLGNSTFSALDSYTNAGNQSGHGEIIIGENAAYTANRVNVAFNSASGVVTVKDSGTLTTTTGNFTAQNEGVLEVLGPDATVSIGGNLSMTQSGSRLIYKTDTVGNFVSGINIAGTATLSNYLEIGLLEGAVLYSGTYEVTVLTASTIDISGLQGIDCSEGCMTVNSYRVDDNGDGTYSLIVSFEIDVPVDCADVYARGFGYATDINEDCSVDLNDFALMAAEWLFCNDPLDAFCTNPNWNR